jgi:outer membrane protein assembly factor BamB
VVALDASTGETLWTHSSPARPYEDMDASFGPGRNATPLILGDRLIAVGVGGDLRCLALADGKPLWSCSSSERYGHVDRKEEYGFSASPLPYRGKVLVAAGGERHGVVALDPADGTLVWGSEPFAVSYAPPVLLELAGREQLVLFTPAEVLGLDPVNGRRLWSIPCKCMTGNNLTQAVALDADHVWVAAQLDGGTRVLHLAPGENGALEPRELWRDARKTQAHWNSFEIDGCLYGSFGGNYQSELCALDWRNGEILWRSEDFHAVKGVLADEKLVFLGEDGRLAIGRLAPEGVTILAEHALLSKEAWTAPTLVGTTLYARDRKEIVAVDLARGGLPR